ncbi:MAG: hypothetical protein VYE22_41015 [Myxococcota bacterium]|nr:hypothetical protein [Myxococcota bacterium]
MSPGTELPPLPPPCAATAEDVATVAMMVEVLDVELGVLEVGEGIRALGGDAEGDCYGAFVVRRDRRTLRRWLSRTVALRRCPRPRPTTTATAPRATRRETRSQPTATDPGGGDDDNGPPDGPLEDQRPAACPVCGSGDHWRRPPRNAGPLPYECLASLSRGLVMRLRGSARRDHR